ncbi:hypothetical protein, partial [Muribaculum intestinale]|uniref:hypothetical protein n=1 Tax=Muribaculum intestinale TaxID=1796646 RepID=UPI0026EADD35
VSGLAKAEQPQILPNHCLYVSTVFFMTGGMLLKYAEPYCLVLYVSLSTCGEQRFFIILIYPSRL